MAQKHCLGALVSQQLEEDGWGCQIAVWAVRDDAAVSRMAEVATLCTAIADAGHAFRDDPTGIAHVAAERFPFDEHYIRGYLQHLRYGFADAERAGLARFLELARRAGELQDVPALEALAA
jgi:predicted solute-binding protein